MRRTLALFCSALAIGGLASGCAGADEEDPVIELSRADAKADGSLSAEIELSLKNLRELGTPKPVRLAFTCSEWFSCDVNVDIVPEDPQPIINMLNGVREMPVPGLGPDDVLCSQMYSVAVTGAQVSGKYPGTACLDSHGRLETTTTLQGRADSATGRVELSLFGHMGVTNMSSGSVYYTQSYFVPGTYQVTASWH